MNDKLLSAKQIAEMVGYAPEQYKLVYPMLAAAGVEPWRPPTPGSRMVRWYESDIAAFMRNGGSNRGPRAKQPESAPTSRFRKQAS